MRLCWICFEHRVIQGLIQVPEGQLLLRLYIILTIVNVFLNLAAYPELYP